MIKNYELRNNRNMDWEFLHLFIILWQSLNHFLNVSSGQLTTISTNKAECESLEIDNENKYWHLIYIFIVTLCQIEAHCDFKDRMWQDIIVIFRNEGNANTVYQPLLQLSCFVFGSKVHHLLRQLFTSLIFWFKNIKMADMSNQYKEKMSMQEKTPLQCDYAWAQARENHCHPKGLPFVQAHHPICWESCIH